MLFSLLESEIIWLKKIAFYFLWKISFNVLHLKQKVQYSLFWKFNHNMFVFYRS